MCMVVHVLDYDMEKAQCKLMDNAKKHFYDLC